MGAGKTTAIRSISDIAPVSTEVSNTDREAYDKESTTVALDYGQLFLEDGTALRLFGTPGQVRFSFMWEILSRGSLGTILLIDGSSTTALADLRTYVDTFRKLNPGQPFVIGVGRVPLTDVRLFDEYRQTIDTCDVVAPVFGVDVRIREDVLLLIETLLCLLEVKMPEARDVIN
jgi:signal recognition particle receptor subunit beta